MRLDWIFLPRENPYAKFYIIIIIIIIIIIEYPKILKISPGAYIFQRPFLTGLFLEELIFEGAYLRSVICVSQSIGLAL